MKWKVDPDTPPKPTFRNCIRCLRQYKLTVPYDECVPENRDFCDDCLMDLSYEERQNFAQEANPPIPSEPMEKSLQEIKDFPLVP